MNKIPLTILIPCSDDPLLGKCIESVDEDVEILVVLNKPSETIKKLVKQYPSVKTVTLVKRGIGLAYNRGIQAAKNQWILLMDSDCLFNKGAIRKMWNLTKDFRVVKGKVAFDSRNIESKITSKLREYTTSDNLNAYSPPLLFHKSIKKDTDYYFDSRLIWSEDADFNNRIQKSKIAIGYDPNAAIFHKPLSFKEDLRSAYRYGIGRQIGKEIGVYEPHTLKSFTINVTKVVSNSFDIGRTKGIDVAIYYFALWNSVFRLGTFLQHYFHIYDY